MRIDQAAGDEATMFDDRTERALSERGRKAALARQTMGARGRSDNHPATSQREYTAEELELLRAVEAFQRSTGRRFPTWTDLLGIVRSLGYTRAVPPVVVCQS
jgi:hypothetical protein